MSDEGKLLQIPGKNADFRENKRTNDIEPSLFNLGACAGVEPVEGGGGGETVALMMLCHIIWDT